VFNVLVACLLTPMRIGTRIATTVPHYWLRGAKERNILAGLWHNYAVAWLPDISFSVGDEHHHAEY
jgi:hypothetical protein